MSDNVNHPSHYTGGNIECIEAIKEATKDLTGIEATDTGNILKYIWRWKKKNGIEDLKKAQWYLNHLIKEIEPEETVDKLRELHYKRRTLDNQISELSEQHSRELLMEDIGRAYEDTKDNS
jgi:hypothetical protein